MLKKYGGALADEGSAGVPIYRASILKTGGSCQYALRQMLMDVDKSGIQGLSNSLGLEEADVDRLLCLDDDKLCRVVSHCIRLHYPISEAAGALFDGVKKHLEAAVVFFSDDPGLCRRCEDKDLEKSERSSSPVLLWASQDPAFRKKLSAAQKKALDKWKYAGWCPLDASHRLRTLLRFPIHVFENLPTTISAPLSALEDASKSLVAHMPPKVKQKTEDGSPREKPCDVIVRRVMALKNDLKKWETYYADSAKTLSKMHLSMLLEER